MSAAEPTTMAPDWANLHEELLAHTAKKLTNPIHFVRFRAVCRCWRSAARPADLPPQTPWLLIANLIRPSSSVQPFLCPLSKKRFSLNLPSAITGKSILGSSRGWLVIYEEETEHLCLLNPLTASRIPLPPLEVGPSPLHNASLSSDPAAGGGRRCIVMVTSLSSSKFVFCRLGDAGWTSVNMGSPIQDPVFAYQGSFYIVDRYGRTTICGMSPADEVMHIPTVGGSSAERYLVESADGEHLFLVATFSSVHVHRSPLLTDGRTDPLLPDGKTEVFELLDKSAAPPVWSKIDGIGGNAMFLSCHSCCCVKPSDFSICRKNTLYFIPIIASTYLDIQGVGLPGLDDGVTKIFRRLRPTSYPRGFWYTPIIR